MDEIRKRLTDQGWIDDNDVGTVVTALADAVEAAEEHAGDPASAVGELAALGMSVTHDEAGNVHIAHSVADTGLGTELHGGKGVNKDVLVIYGLESQPLAGLADAGRVRNLIERMRTDPAWIEATAECWKKEDWHRGSQQIAELQSSIEAAGNTDPADTPWSDQLDQLVFELDQAGADLEVMFKNEGESPVQIELRGREATMGGHEMPLRICARRDETPIRMSTRWPRPGTAIIWKRNAEGGGTATLNAAARSCRQVLSRRSPAGGQTAWSTEEWTKRLGAMADNRGLWWLAAGNAAGG